MSLSAGQMNRRVGFSERTRRGGATLADLKESVRRAAERAEHRAQERESRVVVTRIRKEGDDR